MFYATSQKSHTPGDRTCQHRGQPAGPATVTSIDFPGDDMGVRNLRLKNASSTAVTPTTETRPGSDTLETESKKIIPPPAAKPKQRRKKDRRQKNRREGKEPVVLDTRSHRDRRRNDRRQTDIKTTRYGSRNTVDDDPVSENRGIDEIV